MAGQGGRAAHGEAMHMLDWMEVRRWWRASAVKVCGGDGEHGSARQANERERVRMSEHSGFASLFSPYWPDQTGRHR